MRNIVLIFACFFLFNAFGQSNTRISQFNFAQAFFNPSMLCFDAPIMVDLFGRNQWLGFDGGPTTIGLSGQYEIDPEMAVGLTTYHDRIGVSYLTSVQGQYAYRLTFNQTNILSFGAGIGIDQKSSNIGNLTLTDPDDYAFSESYSKLFFNASFGISYATPQYYVGLGMPQLFQNLYNTNESQFNPKRWHYYLSGGAYWGEPDYYIFNPHLGVKYVMGAPIQVDLILRNTFRRKFSFVVGYRTENAIIAGFDVTIAHRFRVGYSANYNIGRLSNLMAMSNEIYLGFGFPYHRDRDDFFYRKYINKKGGFKRTYQSRYKQKNHIH